MRLNISYKDLITLHDLGVTISSYADLPSYVSRLRNDLDVSFYDKKINSITYHNMVLKDFINEIKNPNSQYTSPVLYLNPPSYLISQESEEQQNEYLKDRVLFSMEELYSGLKEDVDEYLFFAMINMSNGITDSLDELDHSTIDFDVVREAYTESFDKNVFRIFFTKDHVKNKRIINKLKLYGINLKSNSFTFFLRRQQFMLTNVKQSELIDNLKAMENTFPGFLNFYLTKL